MPYFSSSICLKMRKATAGSVVVPDLEMRKATAGSVVVPDLEITLTEKSRSPMREMVSSRASVDNPLPAKRMSGVFFCFRL